MPHWFDIAVRLGAGTLIGVVIGINRELHQKPTGVRTLGLVGLGSALIVLVGIGDGRDPTAGGRVVGGVITGLGFLGAGVILREETTGRVRGLTTAAAMWVTACLGCACGLGEWTIVIVASVFAGLLLAFGGPFEKWAARKLNSDDTDDDG